MNFVMKAGLVSSFFLSLSSPVLASSLVTTGQPFSTEFVVFSDNAGGGLSSQGPSTIRFEQSAELLTTNFPGFEIPNLFVTTEINQLDSSIWRLSLVYETATNDGFIPAGINLGGQAINEWIIDLGSIFSNENVGIQLNQPVQYNSATISWFDDGNEVLQDDALNRILLSSSSTNLMGQFTLRTADPNFDLGSFGNGIDAANILVEVSVTSVPESSINLQVWLFLVGCILISGLNSTAKLRMARSLSQFSQNTQKLS